MSSSSKLQSLRRLAYFAAIAEAGSIRGGATKLGLSVPVVSTALAELEQELSLVLAVRTTRTLTLTPEGQRVFLRAQEMLAAAEEALFVQAEDHKPSGKLAMTIPVEFCVSWLPERLMGFYSEYPDIDLHIETSDTVAPLERSEFDLSIRASYRSPQSYAKPARRLTNIPDYLGRIDLHCVAKQKPRYKWDGDTVYMDIPLIEQTGRGESLVATNKKDGRVVSIHGNRLITINNHDSALGLVRSGLGAVRVMAVSAHHYLKEKKLTRIMPGYDFGHLDIELTMRDSLPSPQAKAFKRYLLNYEKLT